MQELHFQTGEQYLRSMHPEYCFVFSVERNALAYWGYTREQAWAAQSDMVEIACSQAKRLDLERDLKIVLDDGSCPDRLVSPSVSDNPSANPSKDWMKQAS